MSNSRKIVASIYVTLDGVYQAPGDPQEFERGGWVFRYPILDRQ